MRLPLVLSLLGAVTASGVYDFYEPGQLEDFGQKFISREARFQDGAEYDEDGNRAYPRVSNYNRPEQQQYRIRRQNQAGNRYQKASSNNRPLRPVANRPLRPVERREPQEAARREYIFNPNQQRPLRPVVEKYQEPVYEPVYQEPAEAQRYKPSGQQADRNIDRFYTVPEEKKVFERNAVEPAEDQLEGESFQPTYTPYAAPKTAYDNSYVPPEQKSIQDAVAAGANGYNGDTYEDPKRLSFQIHGQEGPNSYRFGYDTGIGYNRQFRYEERDDYGVLHGRYGYYDQEGKLQIVNYTADPKTGFHAEGEHVPKAQY